MLPASPHGGRPFGGSRYRLADDLEGRVDADVAAGPCLGVIRQALEALAASRSREGEALRAILSGHVETIAQLTRRAEADPASQPDAILARLKEQVERAARRFGILRRGKAQCRGRAAGDQGGYSRGDRPAEGACRGRQRLLRDGGAIGRKLDFLAQEFNRETNTICSKSPSAALTAVGLELKAVIDQFREQVQNLQ
jgi:uncharacterized protein YicC (UPF0701 family)